jgi:phage tail sheath protein FI
MPQYLSPGVYVEEVEAGSRPIEGVGTAVAAFVGLAAQGPFNEPTLVTNWSQFTQAFGDFVGGSYLAHAVYGYFNNGGGACYVVRIGQDGQAPAARGELKSGADATVGAYRVTRSRRDRRATTSASRSTPRRARTPRMTSSRSRSSAAAASRRRSRASAARRASKTPPRSSTHRAS